jgi:signal transduction histidine kinase
VVLTASRLLEQVAGDADAVRRTARQIGASGQRMSRMIEDMLDLARGRLAGGIPVQPEPMDLAAVVRRVVHECQSAQPRARIEVTVAGDTACHADPERLAQVVSNLVGNALQHGRPGEPVGVRLDGGDAAWMVLSVGNAGEVAPDALPHLFEAFSGGARRRGDGLGLGLYISQQIAQAHGGGVSVRSETGRTEILVRIPRGSSTQANVASMAAK